MARNGSLEISSLPDSLFSQLRHVRRFTGCLLHHQESVAEHSWYVCLFAMLLGRDAMTRGWKIDMGTLLCRATVHDVEEGVTGDFPRPFKYSNEELKKHLDLAAKRGLVSIYKSIELSEEDRLWHRLHWVYAKDKDAEGAILSFCDLLAVLEFTHSEVQAGSRQILSYVMDAEQYIESFKVERYAVIHPYLDDARGIFSEIKKLGVGRG